MPDTIPADALSLLDSQPSRDVTRTISVGQSAYYISTEVRRTAAHGTHRCARNNAVFQVHAPGARPETRDYGLEIVGQALAGAGEGDDATRWTGTLPQSGSYLVVVGATRGNASYRLTVTIR